MTPKPPLPFDPKRPSKPRMPDPNAGDVVARGSITVPDSSFDVVLRRGDEIQHIFFKREDPETWSGVVGIVVPAAGAEQLRQQMNARVDAAVADGWDITKDDRKV